MLLALAIGGATTQAKRRGKMPVRHTRVSDKRVHLLHADRLYYDRWSDAEAQILVGHVRFRHEGATLTCDSARFYELTNSFEGFQNVRMVQGDTLTLTADKVTYNGEEMMALARENVVLKHRKSTLYTDSLNFDRLYSIGYFIEGGKLIDGTSTLTSDWGEYNTKTREAVFNYDVRLKDKKMLLTSDTLHYDTRTRRAHVTGPSHIINGRSDILTQNGYYTSPTEKSELFDRSTVRNGGKEITADSIYHDSRQGTSYCYRNIVYRDTVNRNIMTGDYGEYNDSTGYAMATKRARAIDYSQGDSLFVHADTLKLYSFNLKTDSVYRKLHAYPHVRAYRTDVQAVCDSMVYVSKDSLMTMYRDPIVWNMNQQLLGDQIDVYLRDSTVDRAHVIGHALSVEQMNDTIHFNQVQSDEMFAYFIAGEIDEARAKDNVTIIYHMIDDSDSTLIGQVWNETSELRMRFLKRKLQTVWTPKSQGTMYPMTQIPPDRRWLPRYAWYDYIRPKDKTDIFNWRAKKSTP